MVMNVSKIVFLSRQIHIYVPCLNKFVKKQEQQFDKSRNLKNGDKFAKHKVNNTRSSQKNKEEDSNEFNDELMNIFSYEDNETKLNLSTKKNIQKKTSSQQNVDKGMSKLIQDVVKELKIVPDEKALTKRQLLNRFKVVQESLPVETKDFESLLNDIRKADIPTDSSPFIQNFSSSDSDASMKINLSSDNRLGIFERGDFSKDEYSPNPDRKTWSSLDWYKHYKNEHFKPIKESVKNQAALSGYHELIQWTESNKLWKFPVDNEDGMAEERNVPFYDHVFFDEKLNEGDWCPKQGPIRDFMVSVTTALSLNPYLSVQEKHEHIDWFRDYFVERLQTIKKLGLVKE